MPALLRTQSEDNQPTYKVLHASPTHYSADSVIGGGEKYVLYMCRAMKKAAPALGFRIENKVIAFGERPGLHSVGFGVQCEVLPGRPWDPYSISPQDLTERLKDATLVVVHQCLSAFGLFVASHAKLLNKIVVGLDHGGGEHPLVHATPRTGRLFDLLHAYSQYGSSSYENLDAPVNVVPGPVDTEYYYPDNNVLRDSTTVLSVGRLLPHKGFDRIIKALPKQLRLIIIGSGYDRDYCAYLEHLSAGKDVQILDGLSDPEVLEYMRTAGLYVHASTHCDYQGKYYAKPELLGLAPLEAMSTGTPALVSTAGSLPELSNVNGCAVFRDDDHLAELLAEFAAGRGDYPRPSVIAENVERKYGLQVFGENFLRGVLRAVK